MALAAAQAAKQPGGTGGSTCPSLQAEPPALTPHVATPYRTSCGLSRRVGAVRNAPPVASAAAACAATSCCCRRGAALAGLHLLLGTQAADGALPLLLGAPGAAAPCIAAQAAAACAIWTVLS